MIKREPTRKSISAEVFLAGIKAALEADDVSKAERLRVLLRDYLESREPF